MANDNPASSSSNDTAGDAESLMTRAAAARTLLDATEGRNNRLNKDREIYAFLSVFHPEMSHEQKREFLAACGDD